MTDPDSLRLELRLVTDPKLLRDALESTLDYMDELADRDRFSEDIMTIVVYTRRLIRLRLAGQTKWGVPPPPEVPNE